MNKKMIFALLSIGCAVLAIVLFFVQKAYTWEWVASMVVVAIMFLGMWWISDEEEETNRGRERSGYWFAPHPNPSTRGSYDRALAGEEDEQTHAGSSTGNSTAATSLRSSWWSRFKNRFSRRSTGSGTIATPVETESETETISEPSTSSSWSWLWWVVVAVTLAGAWWYFELPWQFIPHAIAVILALYGLAIKNSLSQFHRLTPVLVILTVGLGVVLTPQNPEWAWMLTTGFVPLLVAIAYALANELHHQQSVSAAAVVSFIWMLVYALLTTFDIDPIASLVIGFVIALGSLFWIPEVRERTGVTAPSEPMSSPAKWAIGLVVAAIVIIALSNSYGTAWLSNLLEGLPKIAWFVFWTLVLIFLWAQKEETLKTSTKVWLTILILAIGLYWITVSVLLAIGNFFGGVFAFLTSEWWIMTIVGVVFIILMWKLLRHVNINPFWVGGIVLLFWILFASGLFDGTRGISYPVLTPSQGVEQNIDHGPGNNPGTQGTPAR